MKQTFDTILNAVTSESELSPRTLKLMSLLFLTIAASLCFLTYTKTSFWVYKSRFSIEPKFISAAIALAMLAPLYARGILTWSKSVYGLISLILFWLVFAGLVEIAMGANTWGYYLLGAAVLLSWLGMQGVAGFAWSLAFAASVYALVSTNVSMGVYGAVYLISAFLGCILHSGMGPSDFIAGVKREFEPAPVWRSEGVFPASDQPSA